MALMNGTVSIACITGCVLDISDKALQPAAVTPGTSNGIWSLLHDAGSLDQFSLLYNNDPDLALTLSHMPPLSGSKDHLEIIFTPLGDPPALEQLWTLKDSRELSEPLLPVLEGRLQSAAMDRSLAPEKALPVPGEQPVVGEASNPSEPKQRWLFRYL